VELSKASVEIQSNLIKKRQLYIEELRRQLIAKQQLLQQSQDPSVSTSKELEEFLAKQDHELASDIEDHRKRLSEITVRKAFSKLQVMSSYSFL